MFLSLGLYFYYPVNVFGIVAMPSEQLYPSSENNQFEAVKQNHHFGYSPKDFEFEPVHIIYDPRIRDQNSKKQPKMSKLNWNPQKFERTTLSERGEPSL